MNVVVVAILVFVMATALIAPRVEFEPASMTAASLRYVYLPR